MRILQLSSARTFGGGERHFADLANALAARGHAVYAALVPRSPLRDELGALPRANLLSLPLRNALDLQSARALAAFVRERRIDVVHAHVARDYPLAALAAGRATGARLFITRHVLFPLGRVHRLTLRRAASVIAVSEAVARALRARRIVAPEKIRVIHNGIDFERYERAAQDFDRAEFRQKLAGDASLVVGMVGELSRVKAQEDFVRAAATVARETDERVAFVIVGEDASRGGETRARLERLIAELRLRERVRLLGRRADIAQVLASLDLFVNASRSEAFGLVIVEAMAADVPVLATATEGAREIIHDGQTGRLTPPGDAEALAANILALLRDPPERARLAAQAHADARRRFSLARMVEATEQAYLAALVHKV